MNYTPTIGLEIHAELKTKSKMFCSCKNDPLEKNPNVNVCPICLGHPGTLPGANEEAIQKVIQVGLALGCEIPEKSKFDRKNYFYPDLPKGYQISQYDQPLCKGGKLKIGERDIRITRVHLEEDTGRLVHPAGADYSLVDFNRAGVPLMELVTEPDIANAKEAVAFAKELQLILRYLDASDADMEKGQMRVEVNISLSQNTKKLGTKVEIKNLNSFIVVGKAIKYEAKRQKEVLEGGGKVVQETRGWDDMKGETFSQREKEEAHDYRYFPEPDLPPFHFAKQDIEKIRSELPELPRQRRERMTKQYKLSENEVEIFVQNKELGEYFEKVASSDVSPKLAANYILTYPDFSGISAENFARVVALIDNNTLSSTMAKTVFEEMLKSGKNPEEIIAAEGLIQITDTNEIETIAKEIIASNPKAVEDFQKGKQNALQFLVGQLMAKTHGKASPALATQILRTLLTK
ncbi:MAG: Asp-tRNA(Asn)/Glu-tRNA(Gln) amidotransferase subunit GatB [Candidatus Wildermuthbacteria bacterium]|nr:Asp-tRNA(Asn)/Glu-tRNA(Gln) amidotransferase subunit GatB [Candidatus Wildermuthbacteria bacterium]